MHSNIYPPIYIDKTANFKEKNIMKTERSAIYHE